jgi:hypothetical protein
MKTLRVCYNNSTTMMSRIQKLLVSLTSSKETSLIIPLGEIHSGVLKVVVIFANIKEVIYAY